MTTPLCSLRVALLLGLAAVVGCFPDQSGNGVIAVGDGGAATADATLVDRPAPDAHPTDSGAPDAPRSLDASADVGDVGRAGDAVGRDAVRAGCDVAPVCGDHEVCGDGFDNDCNGLVDDRCACLPGTRERCLPGTPNPGAPLCAYGEQACVGPGEFGTWGACAGVGAYGDASTSEYGCRRIVILGAPGANASSNFQAWLTHRGAIVTRAQTTAADGVLRRELLDTFDLAIVDWLQRDYTADEAATLRQWVDAGGGLLVLTGHDSGATASRQISLATALGMDFVPRVALSGPATLLAHPITLDPATMRVLPPVTFNGGLATTVDPALGAAAQVFAQIGTTPVGVAAPLGRGRAALFGDEWIEFDSEWSTMPQIPQLWFNLVSWLSPLRDATPPVCE